MLKEILFLGLGAIFGLGATMSALAFPTYVPHAPFWVWHWLFWGGIALMALMLVDAAFIFWQPKLIVAILLNIGLAFVASALIAQYSTPKKIPVSEKTAIDTTTIYQVGVAVGKVFGARRLPNDATMFDFAEITNCGQFNTNAPFEYAGVKLIFISEKDSALMLVGRMQDSPIRMGVLAKVAN